MTKNKKFKRLTWSPISRLIVLVGAAIIMVGIYFQIYGMTTSGVTMAGKWSKSYGTGTLDGKSLIWCGIVIIGFGLILVVNKKPKDT
jgi:hypothetical protein